MALHYNDEQLLPIKGTKSAPVAVSVGITATLIRAANADRVSVTIMNNGAAAVYLGRDATVTTATGLPVAAGATFSDSDSLDAWYGIVVTGTNDVRVVEVS